MLAFHAIFSAYGFWLPNDPRGSWSTWIGSWELFRYGGATKVDTRISVAARPHVRAAREEARHALKHPPVVFNGHQALAIARGFNTACQTYGYRLHACAILPEHVHLVIGATQVAPGTVIGHFKRKASDQLLNAAMHPFGDQRERDGSIPMCWARKGWKVFLDREEDVMRSVAYVERNPEKEGLRRQRWPFVQPC